ncbi:MAG: hypothetical protein HZB25_07340 [Candidatus Eisenbacteria bacterium]|nr:hypothetical protein [Candidatus Eisenbacteria bacterium]
MIGAALGKFQRPMAFLRAVMAYQLLPQGLNTAVAVTFPGIELVAGLVLLGGLLTAWRPLNPGGQPSRFEVLVEAAGWVTAGMMCLFSVILAAEILMGRKLDCSCFDMLGNYLPFLKSTNVNWGTVGRDVAILALTVPVIVRWPRRASQAGLSDAKATPVTPSTPSS